MLADQYQMVGQLDAANKSEKMHTQIRHLTGMMQNARMSTCIEDRDGNIVMEQENILDGWNKYISELYDDIRVYIPLSLYYKVSQRFLYPQCI